MNTKKPDRSNWANEVKEKFNDFKNHLPDEYKEMKEHNLFSSFAVCLYCGIDNVNEFLSNDITDGSGDSGIDFCHIDENKGIIYIGQTYLAKEWGKHSAKSSKIDGLIAGVNHLLEQSINHEILKIKSKEILYAINSDSISQIKLLYVHNCYEIYDAKQEHVRRGLSNVAQAIYKIFHDHDIYDISVIYNELGIDTIRPLFNLGKKPILIEDKVDLPSNNFIKQNHGDWNAYVISVPGKWIAGIYDKYKNNLFNANFRNYIGTASHKKNINRKIQDTVGDQPGNFWIFNNGITAIVNEIIEDDGKLVAIEGISIINGAQTVGSLHEAYFKSLSGESMVLFRIIKCQDNYDLIDNIIEYNNTQNIIKPEDKWSKDDVQKTLSAQFLQYFDINYIYRRSIDRLDLNRIEISHMGKILCAFHGDFQTAFRGAKNIFNNKNIYDKIFKIDICAEHCFVVYALSVAIDKVKKHLNSIAATDDGLMDTQQNSYDILQFSSSKIFLLYVIGSIMEEIYGKKIANKYLIVIQSNDIVLSDFVKLWEQFVLFILPIIYRHIERHAKREEIEDDIIYTITRTASHVKEITKNLKSEIKAEFDHFSIIQDIRKNIKLKI